MLILNRNSGEKIRINDDVVVTVLEVSQDKVRMGVTAPKGVVVHREEVFNRIRRSMIEERESV